MGADQVLTTAAAWIDDGRGVAIATVVATWGSSPRPAGSRLVVRDDGEMVGSVSGGCVEGAVVEKARAVIAGAPAEVMEFGVSDEQAWEVGLACGGTVRVHVGAATPAVLRTLLDARERKRPACVVTYLHSGVEAVVEPGAASAREVPDALFDACVAALRTDRATTVEVDARPIFVNPLNPPLRMIVVGAVHVAQPLARMAAIAGYEVTVVDPRGAFATEARFPGVALVTEWPDAALEALAIDRRTAIVALTHDPKIDDPALQVALASEAFYVGALGSKKTHAARLVRLREAGLGEDALARIHGPVGLAIGARSPAEIAVSILAEVTERLRAGGAP